jgi:hypothetical protein
MIDSGAQVRLEPRNIRRVDDLALVSNTATLTEATPDAKPETIFDMRVTAGVWRWRWWEARLGVSGDDVARWKAILKGKPARRFGTFDHLEGQMVDADGASATRCEPRQRLSKVEQTACVIRGSSQTDPVGRK